jgi:hypothetical protein
MPQYILCLLRSLSVSLVVLISILSTTKLNAQCAGPVTSVPSPPPTGGVYLPGSVVTICATLPAFNVINFGANWFEGFDITLGPGWVPGSVTPISAPNNINGGGGNWIWVGGTFNANGNSFGPGYFFDLDGDGISQDDYGDYAATGPWEMCFSAIVGNTPGASLAANVVPVSDGSAGSWTSGACDGENADPIIPPGTTISNCTNQPTVAIVSTTNVQCPGQSTGIINLNASGGSGAPYTYQINGVTVGMPAVNLAAATYQVAAIDNSGCPSMPIAAVVNGPNPIVHTPTITQTIACNTLAENFQPGQFDINSTGGTAPFTYTLGTASNQTGIFSVATAGTVTVNVSDANGCASTSNVTFTPPLSVPIVFSGLTDAACSGAATGSVDVNAFGLAGPFTYQLLYPSGPVSNSTGLFPNLPPGDFMATVTSAAGCEFDTLVTIGEQSNIATSTPVVTNVSCFGNSTGSISLSANGGTAPYTFSANGVSFTNIANNATVLFSGLDAGSYEVTVDDAIGCTFVTPVIDVTQPAQALSAEPIVAGTICEGASNGSIQSNISGGTTPYAILWSNTSNATNISNLAAGIYSVDVTDNNGCMASGSATIVATSLPIASVGTGGEICEGFNYNLTYTGPGGIGYQYQWLPVTGLNNATSPDPIASPSATTNYTLVITDANGCQSLPSTPVVVEFHPTPATPIINPNGPLEFCEGNSVTLSIGGGASYLWSNGAVSSSVTATQTGTFTVRLTDNFGCVSPVSAAANVVVNPLPAAPQLTSSTGATFCQGASTILSAQPSNGITWSNGSSNASITVSTAGVYSAFIEDANGCQSANSTIAVSVTPLTPSPLITSSGLTTLCEGDSVLLTCSTADSYAWVNTADASTSAANSIYASKSGTYSVTTSGVCPSPNMTASITITVRPIPEPNIVFDTTTVDCLPSVLSFSANPTGLGPLAYGWNFGDGMGATTLNPFHEYQNPGLYTVGLMVSDQFGCTGFESIPEMVKILPRADLKYVIAPLSVSISDAEVVFSGLSENSTGDNWQIQLLEEGFDTLDVIAFDSSFATHTFADTGVYLISYTVTTAEGCIATATDWVRVYEDFDVFIPMGFSPDGDGVNDEFFPVLPGFEIDDYEFRIFNRWGRQVFLTYSTSTGWSGDDMPAGYYFWKIKGKSKIEQEPIDLSGYLFLLR